MIYSELYQLLEKNGWNLKRTGGHKIYVHPNFGKPIPVPNHPGAEVPKGTLNQILKRAGLK